MNEVALKEIFLQELCFSHVSVLPGVYHTGRVMSVLSASLNNKVKKHKTESEKMVKLVYIDTVALRDNDHNQGGANARSEPLNTS